MLGVGWQNRTSLSKSNSRIKCKNIYAEIVQWKFTLKLKGTMNSLLTRFGLALRSTSGEQMSWTALFLSFDSKWSVGLVVPQLTKRWPCLGCHGAHNYRVWSTIYFDANKHHHQVCNYGIIQNYKDYFRNKITINEKLEIKYEMKEKKICIALFIVDARSPHTFTVGRLWIAF